MVSKVDETESSRTALLVLHHTHTKSPPWKDRQVHDQPSQKLFCHQPSRRTVVVFLNTKCRKEFLEFLITEVFSKIFDVDVCELHSFGTKLNFSFFAWLKVANKPGKRTTKPDEQLFKRWKQTGSQSSNLPNLTTQHQNHWEHRQNYMLKVP